MFSPSPVSFRLQLHNTCDGFYLAAISGCRRLIIEASVIWFEFSLRPRSGWLRIFKTLRRVFLPAAGRAVWNIGAFMCGIAGISGKSDVAAQLYEALSILQHRGQDAAGMATCSQGRMFLHKTNGLVRVRPALTTGPCWTPSM